MIGRKNLEELEQISNLTPEECQKNLQNYIERQKEILQKIHEYKGWFISILQTENNYPWVYFRLCQEKLSFVRRKGEGLNQITLGKIHVDDYKKDKELLNQLKEDMDINGLKEKLIPLE